MQESSRGVGVRAGSGDRIHAAVAWIRKTANSAEEGRQRRPADAGVRESIYRGGWADAKSRMRRIRGSAQIA
jgi:hypothetical protein